MAGLNCQAASAKSRDIFLDIPHTNEADASSFAQVCGSEVFGYASILKREEAALARILFTVPCGFETLGYD